jgi:hypothetical protein
LRTSETPGDHSRHAYCRLNGIAPGGSTGPAALPRRESLIDRATGIRTARAHLSEEGARAAA